MEPLSFVLTIVLSIFMIVSLILIASLYLIKWTIKILAEIDKEWRKWKRQRLY